MTKKSKEILAWAGFVEGKIHFYYGMPQIYKSKHKSQENYEDVRKVEIREVPSDPMSQDKLLPCPFCGGETKRGELVGAFAVKGGYNYDVHCTKCLATYGRCNTQFIADYSWNTRPQSQL